MRLFRRLAVAVWAICFLMSTVTGCGRNGPAAGNVKGDRPDRGKWSPSEMHGSIQRAQDGQPETVGNHDPFAPWKEEKPDLPGAILCVISNGESARPQSGLEKADVVYEIEAEGGITRFLAVFYHNAPEKIGPIRSMRMYYAAIAKAYDSPVAHAGGNADVLALLRKGGFKNLDEIYGAGEYFYRTKDRRSPDNLYTSADSLLRGAKNRGFGLTPPPEKWGNPPAGGNPALKASIPFRDTPSFKNVVTWKYDNGAYERYVNDSAHRVDSGEIIRAANVIVAEASHRIVPIKVEGKDDYEMDIGVVGSGKALLFRNGSVYEGAWRKESQSSHMLFFSQGKEMAFERGPVWIEVVPDLAKVLYK